MSHQRSNRTRFKNGGAAPARAALRLLFYVGRHHAPVFHVPRAPAVPKRGPTLHHHSFHGLVGLSSSAFRVPWHLAGVHGGSTRPTWPSGPRQAPIPCNAAAGSHVKGVVRIRTRSQRRVIAAAGTWALLPAHTGAGRPRVWSYAA